MKHFEVVAAIIINNNKILCVQRDTNIFEYISRKYEFPGGKIEPGESKVEAIKREINEELKLEILVQDEFMTVHHQYPDFELRMHSFICQAKNISLLTLTEHVDYKWLKKYELDSLDWAAADIPIVQKLMKE